MPNANFTQTYGMTELAPVGTLLAGEDRTDPALARSYGRAAHAEVRIVDPDDTEVPRDTVGEIIVRGDNVMLGYWNMPDETAAALRGGRMHTGDAGYMDDRGYVFVVDRLKNMIVSGGENVYSAEVENALVEHPSISQAAVIGQPDDLWGERVHSVLVCNDGVEIDLQAARSFCRRHIANYKPPRRIEWVDALPVSDAGKVLKRELRQTHWPTIGRGIN